ncbi:RsmB/NOP family class I SAM-dependent RNA methyltransferase [Sphingomonas sp. CL5.1]|uniref:RsmB/NOP family class I SAM-dependent RNA methyltransferase n=1 Tax=Sphingomonas sp. CL5.1 TaxID=2653203 RepID=UPI00158439A8|nr:RsmB/NOP family class I SAM-dependent RNA methyltransferase [Sphingomonas sp. CL5.1]QKS00968.1 RsmB/NOP family class I SAM-dependent RNA methyltransferase [Sphingomonas sp. CL5.1]
MTPAARIQAAIEVLDLVLVAARESGAAADTVVQRYFSTRRYAGSKDRRAVRDLVFAAIRACGEAPPSGRAALLLLARGDAALAAGFDGSPHGPAPIVEGEPVAVAGTAPAWLVERMREAELSDTEIAALVTRAPLDVRVNTLVTTPEKIAAEIADAAPIPGVPDALRLLAGTNVEPFAGRVEVQDAGSQIVAGAARVEPGMTIVDLCAGAGGKTLALAAAMRNAGRVVAADTDRARLARLAPRATRAGVTIAETVLLDPGRELVALEELRGAADVVLIDAPCSGTGTWRRNPEARWRLSPARLARLVETQRRLLDIGADLTRPGGALVHIVCSLLDEEGVRQIEDFLARHPGWKAETPALPLGRMHGAGFRLTPAHDGTDGFFVARLIAPC